MRNKTIVFKVNSFPTISETFVVSNIVEAIRQGLEVVILIKNKNEIASSSQQHLLAKYNLLNKVVVLKKPVHSLKRILFAGYCILQPIVFYHFLKYSLKSFTFNLNLLFRMHYWNPYRKAKIVHVHFADMAEEISLLKQMGFLEGKILVTFHGYDAFFSTPELLIELQERYKLMFQIADRITVNSNYLKNQVLQLGCPTSKLKVIPVGIQLVDFNPEQFPKCLPKTEVIKLISVGRLVEIKGHLFGLNTIKYLVDQGLKISYTIIGEGVMRNQLEQEIVNLQLESNVQMLGEQSQQFVKEQLDGSHLFLMTSVKDSSGREEAQGVVLLEAQAMGLPVIGFDSGGVATTVNATSGILVSEKDSVALAKAVIEIVKAPVQYQKRSLVAREWVQTHFSVEHMTTQYYKDLIW